VCGCKEHVPSLDVEGSMEAHVTSLDGEGSMEADITSLDVGEVMEGDIGFEVLHVGARWESTSILLTWGDAWKQTSHHIPSCEAGSTRHVS